MEVHKMYDYTLAIAETSDFTAEMWEMMSDLAEEGDDPPPTEEEMDAMYTHAKAHGWAE
jgi:hypothetical protein